MNTLFLLMAEHGTGDIPLTKIAGKYFGIKTDAEAKKRAAMQRLPVPAYRGGSQKSEWLISATDLANHIDQQRAAAEQEWRQVNQ